jgi:hypothetical protein
MAARELFAKRQRRSKAEEEEEARRTPRQYLSFCTSKASKLSTYGSTRVVGEEAAAQQGGGGRMYADAVHELCTLAACVGYVAVF